MKKKHIIATITLILLFGAGLSVLLYPVVSDYLNSLSQSRVIARYNEDLVQLSETDYSDIIEAAKKYNESLLSKPNRFNFTESELKEYYKFDFTGRGIIGTIEIDAIKVNLPIYLGTDENVLQVGLGHLEGSSLPIGGVGTHSVISGHRGLPSSTLLTNADQLIIGDTFTLKILNETLTYQIDNIVIVEPDNLDPLGIDPEKDYCTLTTCTPYGINSHRLLLRGSRIFPENGEGIMHRIFTDARQINIIGQYIIAAIPVLLLSSLYMLVRYITSRRKRRKEATTII